MNINKPLHLFTATALVCALGFSNSWAEVTHDQAVTQIHALAQKVEGVDAREKLVAAYDTLIRAGVSSDKSLAFIQSAVKHEVPVEALVREAREIQAEAKGNRNKADEYASKTMNEFPQQEFSQDRDQGRDLAHEMRDGAGMGAGEGMGGMDMNASGSGFGGSDLGSGSGSGFGGADVGGGAGAGADIGGSVSAGASADISGSVAGGGQ